jgi:hypothetical protein
MALQQRDALDRSACSRVECDEDKRRSLLGMPSTSANGETGEAASSIRFGIPKVMSITKSVPANGDYVGGQRRH